MESKNYNLVLKYILKNVLEKITITKLAENLKITRVGAWKILKKMQSEKLINLSKISSGKTNTYIINLNWENPALEKRLSLYLTEEAMKNNRWINNFLELENKTDFLMIYGSILNYEANANDIDILGMVSDKKRFVEIEKIILKIQKTQIKKIHALFFTKQELLEEIKKSNNAFIDAIKKGVILFGQENFIKFLKDINSK